MFSVADEKEAEELLVVACETNWRSEYVAKELVEEQSLENLYAFGRRLEKMHRLLKQHGKCRCTRSEESPSTNRRTSKSKSRARRAG